MPARSTRPIEQRYADLAAALLDLDDKIATLTEARQRTAAELLALRPDTGSHPAGRVVIKVTRSKRLDLKSIEAKYPHDQRPELYDDTPHVTAAKARKYIAPADLETFEVETAASVKADVPDSGAQ